MTENAGQLPVALSQTRGTQLAQLLFEGANVISRLRRDATQGTQV